MWTASATELWQENVFNAIVKFEYRFCVFLQPNMECAKSMVDSTRPRAHAPDSTYIERVMRSQSSRPSLSWSRLFGQSFTGAHFWRALNVREPPHSLTRLKPPTTRTRLALLLKPIFTLERVLTVARLP